MDKLEKEIVIADFLQLYRQSVEQRAQMELLRRENENLKSIPKESTATEEK